MPTSPLNAVIQQLMARVGPDGGETTDGELLARFLSSRDDTALAALVRRHAPMVWGVCCRLLHNHPDAEDAFQATFLVLVRKAADVPREAVANWLYGVARQTAVRLRATAAKQRRREGQVENVPEPTVADFRDVDLRSVLDEELSRLPDHYRGVIVLCDLEGMTRREAARQLGIPEGSVASRLARAREMLAKRLTRRGVIFSGGSVAAVLSRGSASASTPPALVASTIKAASRLAAGQAAAFSAKVAVLTEGALNAMTVSKLKIATGVLVAVLAVTTLTYGMMLGGQPSGGGDDQDRPEPPRTKAGTQADRPAEKPANPEQPAAPVQPVPPPEKPPHIIEKTDMKGRIPSGLPYEVAGGEPTEDALAVVTKAFFSKMRTYPDIRFREFFDPRYLKKHGLTDRDIAFEFADSVGICNINVADDRRTVLVVLEQKGGVREAFIMRCVVYEGHLYISPEKAPDPKTGIFAPWILRTKVYLGVPRAEGPTWPLNDVLKSPAKVEILSGTTFKCSGVACQLLGVKDSSDPKVRDQAKRFTTLWFKSVGNYIGFYNDSSPLQLKDKTCVVWLRGYDSTMSCLNEQLVRAGLVEIDTESHKGYTFEVATKASNHKEEWETILGKAEKDHSKGVGPNVLFQWPESK
jgi:RNA polymerase sigma factor (sigma-70 family)